MDRLFLRVYANLFVTLLLGGLVARVLIAPRVDAQVGRNIEDTLSGPISVTVELLAATHRSHGDMNAILARAVPHSGVPIALVPRSSLSLSAGDSSRLDRGEMLRTHKPFDAVVFAAVAGTDEVLRIGPINSVHPMGGLRGTAFVLLFAAALSLGVHALLRPIRRRLDSLARSARALGRGELATRAEIGADDEIGTVASAFNGMAGEIQRLVAAQEELLHMTSHELRTPIQRLYFTLERLRDAGSAEERGRSLARMDRDLAEVDGLIEELLTYVRLKEPRAHARATIDLRRLVSELCETLSDMASQVTLAPPVAEEAPLFVVIDARLIRRAISNLIVNAQRHARARVEITLVEEDQGIRVHVDDDGPGVPAADRERIFEPFLRLDDDRTQSSQGFGLGLAIVRRIAEVHGGSVSVLASPLGGARFRLSLPADQRRAASCSPR
ncbi:sensor histidine kinase [Minicystis rosea]|nr:sensor histidine kinase [Minicystis rosea]